MTVLKTRVHMERVSRDKPVDTRTALQETAPFFLRFYFAGKFERSVQK